MPGAPGAAPGSTIILPRYERHTPNVWTADSSLGNSSGRERGNVSDHLGSSARWALVTWSDLGVLHSLILWVYRSNLSHRA